MSLFSRDAAIRPPAKPLIVQDSFWRMRKGPPQVSQSQTLPTIEALPTDGNQAEAKDAAQWLTDGHGGEGQDGDRVRTNVQQVDVGATKPLKIL
jgi:hypothetical protein